MLELVCVIHVIEFYITISIIMIKHIYYFRTLCGKVEEKLISSRLPVHRCIFARVMPMYREEYFGYKYFVLPDYSEEVFFPDYHFRVYGVVKAYSECIVLYKRDVIKCIVCLSDKRFIDALEDEFRKLFRNIIIIIDGSVILWQLCLKFMI